MKTQTFSLNRLTRRASLLAAASVLAACGSVGSRAPGGRGTPL